MDELSIHAVLSPLASDEVTAELFGRLSDWLVANGHADLADFAVPPEEPSLLPEEKESEDVASEFEVNGTSDDVTEEPQWLFPPLESGVRSEAIAVVAPKGGQGKSTIAINLAAGLAEVAPNSVVLVDGDLQFGDVSVALGLEPMHTIVDAVAPESADKSFSKPHSHTIRQASSSSQALLLRSWATQSVQGKSAHSSSDSEASFDLWL